MRAYARRVGSVRLRFDERRRQTLRIEILRILGYHEYAPTTTTILAFVVSKLYFGKVARCFARNSGELSVHAIFRVCYCTIANVSYMYVFFLSKLYFIRNKVTIRFLYLRVHFFPSL